MKKLSNIESVYCTFESPVGTLYLLFTGKILTGISFKKPLELHRKAKIPSLIIREMEEYFEHGIEKFTQEIGFSKGTEFDKSVWLALKKIPYGETRTYKWLAEKVEHPNACRAVGSALSRNPIPIILPCHRVIESDGSLGGYSAGIDIKRRLLDIEYYRKLAKKS
ncbi:MAG: methylated-DNA--[protein]-cysteine S-methyltransferase [Nitrospirota bacterium]